MGTVISLQHLQRVQAMVDRTKGNVLTGGSQMIGVSDLDGFNFAKGAFFAPTVVTDISVDDELWKEEVFGPVVVVKRFSV
jgi:acyl-CoA reductase-like NAD-dependent aldehyde dehydrogenase